MSAGSGKDWIIENYPGTVKAFNESGISSGEIGEYLDEFARSQNAELRAVLREAKELLRQYMEDHHDFDPELVSCPECAVLGRAEAALAEGEGTDVSNKI